MRYSKYSEFEKMHDMLGDMIRLHERRTLGDRIKPNRLESIVERLAMRPLVALARLWVVRKASCFLGKFCEPKGTCLHLIASRSKSILVAQTNASVLIMGESGTGKELLAREIHRRSLRCHGPLIKINCASIPADLFENEFFGHAKGAFTGALYDRKGRYEAAHSGTLFLDEVGEIPLALEAKLLRLLQEGEFEGIRGQVHS